jgi:hypothetical protein
VTTAVANTRPVERTPRDLQRAVYSKLWVVAAGAYWCLLFKYWIPILRVGLPANTLLLFTTYAKLNQLKLNGEHGERSELNVVNEVPLR